MLEVDLERAFNAGHIRRYICHVVDRILYVWHYEELWIYDDFEPLWNIKNNLVSEMSHGSKSIDQRWYITNLSQASRQGNTCQESSCEDGIGH